MQYQYPHLCAPITIAGVTFRNRMFSAPMGLSLIHISEPTRPY